MKEKGVDTSGKKVIRMPGRKRGTINHRDGRLQRSAVFYRSLRNYKGKPNEK